MSEELETLKRIDAKMNQLIAIMKVNGKEKLDTLRKELQADKDYSKILEICEQPVSYNRIVEEVMKQTGAGESTVKLKISQLKSKGALMASRQGREVSYVNSGLLD